MKVVIIGGVAAGPKVGSRIYRLCAEADVTLIEKGKFLSYAGCGLPYYVSGVVSDQKELMSTPIGVVRDSVFFQNVKNMKVLNRTEAIKVDREKKLVVMKKVDSQEQEEIIYDKLVLATGATPIIPPVDGIKLKNIFTLQSLEDSEGIKTALLEDKANDVVIIGGGLIGIEMTEALVEKGCRVTIVERLPQILPILDWELAYQVNQHLEAKGVKVRTSTTVTAFRGKDKVESVVTDKMEIPCDFVVLSVGVKPNVILAKDAGLEIGVTGGVKVNQKMQTSDPDIFAAGDCVESINLVTHEPCFIPLGSTANKQGRVAANNICGIKDIFSGVLGSTVCKVFDFNVARTGLGEHQACKSGFDVVTVLSPAPDKAHFYPGAKLIILKLIADKNTRQLLGVQAVGPGDADKRVDAAAVAITAKMTVDVIANLDLCYAPPYSPAMDNLITAANIVRNRMDGICTAITPMQVKEKIDRGDDFVFLDVRSPGEYEIVHIENTVLIPLGKLRNSLSEIPQNKEIITFCKISLRGYEAALILKAAGVTNVKVMDGGILAWPYAKQVKK
ncbi:MAG: pyridine nucleotide-disulfide oxidoreductase [Candidatus Omnitrophota bacterium]|nr:MAG: pyridine nucleotide-disulfide oxidoreductase [Candidatus Omnitrophota bacterium]